MKCSRLVSGAPVVIEPRTVPSDHRVLTTCTIQVIALKESTERGRVLAAEMFVSQKQVIKTFIDNWCVQKLQLMPDLPLLKSFYELYIWVIEYYHSQTGDFEPQQDELWMRQLLFSLSLDSSQFANLLG